LEYAKGLIALKIREEQHISDLLPDLTRTLDYLECVEPELEPGKHTSLIIKEGENEVIEFKSTFRWDIRAGKTNQAVERASLKTIAAFLNSNGGDLLIGVRDDGSIEGIESDKFVNDDKFLLHLWTLIRTCLGRDISPYIRTILEKTDDRTVCMVQCQRSNRPVFLRQPGFDEAFYIRVGPSSNAMDISEALKYIADHFNVR
jgi:predicted HTH transcriptional regulator